MRTVDQRARHIEHDLHVRELVRDRLEFADRPSELLAALRIVEGVFKRRGGSAGARGGKAEPLVPEIDIDRVPAAVDLAQQGGGGHLHAAVENLRSADGALAQRRDLANLDAGQLGIDQKIGNACLLYTSDAADDLTRVDL